jgi:hypothetical protein
MQISGPIRFAAITFAFAAMLPAQSLRTKPFATTPPAPAPTLPATPATTLPPPPPLTPSQRPPHHAEVTYTNGLLSITADNASLNQILRDAARLTGIKITGGVVDDRVFGQYGPATPADIVATLLQGTGSNVLFVQSRGTAPAELILTPRMGGPTPPNPNAAAMQEREDSDDDEPRRDISNEQPARPTPPEPSPAPAQAIAADPAATPATTAPTTPAATSDQQSPNAVKTPQQIYDQLQQLRQQQQQQKPQ